jgi:acyl-CoA synthetase
VRDLEGTMPLSMMVRERATYDPDGAAYLAAGGTYPWSRYDETADRLAAKLAGLARVPGSGMGPGARVAVWLPDSPRLHAVYLACERAGLVVVGIPGRAGDLELGHLLRKTGASLLICPPAHRERTAAAIVAGLRGDKTNLPSTRPLPLALHAELGSGGTLRVFRWDAGDTPSPVDVPRARRGNDAGLGVDDLWLLNSTSGTTGLSKCVEQTQRTWLSLARHAIGGAAITENDVIMSAVPSPFGYGLWTAHLLPALLGIPCVLRERFDPDRTLRAVAGRRGTLPGHRVTVLACVTTQLRLMLASPLMDELDWSALRVTFTGGERTPPEVIAEWERRTGSAVLQFYGSNEFGGFSGTTLADSEQARRSTAGRVLPGIRYRIYDDAGADITTTGDPGQPGGAGPGVTGGYYGDPDATAELYHPDGHQLLPDLVTVDASGYVRVAGRKADLIIRGGKNISAAAVETEVAAHPSVAEVAAIAVPDRTFGERVCAAVTLRPDAAGPELTVATLREFLAGRGVSKEYFPEHVVVLDEMPVSMGGKIARNALRTQVLRTLRR